MITNDVLRQLRYAMKFGDAKMLDMINQSGAHVSMDSYRSYLKKEDEIGFEECPKQILSDFLDTFIELMRGPKEEEDDDDEDEEEYHDRHDKGKKFANPNKRQEFSKYSDQKVILHKKKDIEAEGRSNRSLEPLNNNQILRKIRIALELKEDDMLNIFKLGGFSLNRSELSAFFRAKGHRNYKPAGDQALRYFMRGIVKNYRG